MWSKSIISFLFLIGLCSFNSLTAQSPETIFKEANKAYAAHQYEAAVEKYEQLLSKGYENSDLHYNLGNAYFRLNQIGWAILHFEKSVKLNPSNEDARFNLKIANLKVMSKIKPVEEFILVRWTRNILHIFSFDTWAKTQVVLGFMALLFFIVYLFTSGVGLKKTGFYLGSISVVLLFITAILAWSAKSDLQNSEYGVIIENTSTVKSEPTEQSKELLTLREGVKFKRLEIVGKWHQIKLSDGTLGWIQEADFRMI